MTKGKKLILAVFFVILFFPIMRVYSEELDVVTIIKTYNNYYFFEEPFDSNNSYSTVNYGLFAPPKLGHAYDHFEIIELSRKMNNNKTIDTFYDFYEKLSNISNASFIPIDSNRYCLTFTLSEGYNTYYNHSCWKSDLDSDWQGYYTKDSNGCYYYFNDVNKNNCIINPSNTLNIKPLEKSCASVNRFTADGSKIRGIDISDINTVLEITRAPLNIVSSEPKNYFEVKKGSNFVSNNNLTSCPDYNDNEHYVNPIGNGEMFSPVLGKYSYDVTYYACKYKPVELKLNCNSSNTITRSCAKTTVEIGNVNQGTAARAEFGISQTGTISNILTPSIIYQGGGIKFGFVYYNTINWDYKIGTLLKNENMTEYEAKKEVLAAVKQKIKNETEVVNDLSVNINITPKVIEIADINNNLIKSCKQTIDGDFEHGVVTTICTVFLPVTNIKPYTGQITGISGEIGNGVNNKMYTEIKYSGNLNISANVSGLNLIKGKKDESDWSINLNPDINDESCQVNIYNRMYEETTSTNKTIRYKFIYRPIDLNNPFPSRAAGANWYNWYSKESNRDRLENSYSKLQYRVELNPTVISEIKKFNNGKNYLDWDGFENDKSSFINSNDGVDYKFGNCFDIKGQNIVGDSS